MTCGHRDVAQSDRDVTEVRKPTIVGLFPSAFQRGDKVPPNMESFCFPDDDVLTSRLQRFPLSSLSSSCTGCAFAWPFVFVFARRFHQPPHGELLLPALLSAGKSTCSHSSGMTCCTTVAVADSVTCVKCQTAESTPPPTLPWFACASSRLSAFILKISPDICNPSPLLVYCLWLMCCSPWFRLYSELLQLLQWLHMSQPSCIPSVTSYLVSHLEDAVKSGRKTGKPLVSLAALWEGIQASPSPPLPPFLSFSRERFGLLSTDGNPGFEQVSLLPLLSRLDAHSLITLHSALLCERRIAFVSRHLPTLSSCLQAAVSLMYPFTWQVCSHCCTRSTC